jgi:hypothetical protein
MGFVVCNTIQQTNDNAFFLRKNTWIDSSLFDQADMTPDVTYTFGSPEHLALAWDLAKTGRQSSLAVGDSVLIEHEGKKIKIVTK